MLRTLLPAALFAAAVSLGAGTSAQAQHDPAATRTVYRSRQQTYVGPQHPSYASQAPNQHPGMYHAWQNWNQPQTNGEQGRPHGPLYSCPQPYVPIETGGTIITNPAFDPHEMLYCHTYRAIYPPFFYKYKWSSRMRGNDAPAEKERLKVYGTRVRVHYSGDYPLFTWFLPPTN